MRFLNWLENIIDDYKYAKRYRKEFKRLCPSKGRFIFFKKCNECMYYNRRQKSCELYDEIYIELDRNR